MTSRAADLWAELIVAEKLQFDCPSDQPQEPNFAVVYRRQKSHIIPQDADRRLSNSTSSYENRLSFLPVKRISWNRSLSTRGRTSVAATVCAELHPQKRKPGRKAKPPLPRGKKVEAANYDKERAYFQEVDDFELMVESPSPNKCATWTTGIQTDAIIISRLSSVLQKWLISKKLNHTYAPPASLSKILETPASRKESACGVIYGSANVKTPEKKSLQVPSGLYSTQNKHFGSRDEDVSGGRPLSETGIGEICPMDEGGYEDIEVGVSKLSLTSRPSSVDAHTWDPFLALLAACGQSAPLTLLEILSKYCEPQTIAKVGEGTFGEAFKVGENVFKIVPFDGDLRVNGEIQKKSEELLEEVILSGTLNSLRAHEGHLLNSCSTFIQTMDMRVCQGHYDASLLKAWEDWDGKHGSENDHPKEFPEKQCYVVFVQEHGGKDLESFVLLNFNEAKSLLAQITLALAVSEAAYEFEHRDLHWGNILLRRKGLDTVQFTLEGNEIHVRTYGLLVSIIDFTLSRINTGEDILFLDLSSDPELFEGPKGDKQSDTYRKMRDVTGEFWEGSFPKTNVLWLQYLVDILLLKKSYERTSKDERDLRSLKKRLNSYGSAREATSDVFFSDLFVIFQH
ncbi:serine/threonine-protein kinase haspin homolog [Nicotiana tabacum]|uniref:Serine/threonine-protein kinase haspin homolog n=3 Tax=Nicotiana TaxID=4085 RepID=A0AC58RLR1_TOBAC|nr:PREDICTED: putative serine/threonine-protein kinase haspin homolog [Nicotiana sylvestris]